MPDTLAVADIQAIIRLLGELAIHPGGIADKRRAVLTGFASLIDSDGWWWVHSAIRNGDAHLFSVIDGNWLNEQQRHLATTVHYTPHIEIINAHFYPFAQREEHVTRTRSQMLSDADWLASRAYLDYFHPAGIADFMGTAYFLGHGLMSSIGFHRNAGKPLFGERERTLTHLVISQIDWLHREGTDAPAAKKSPGLTPRQRQILLLLLQGDSRKQIARKLKLSEFTIGDHLKAIHAHFQVSSRGELLAQFIAGGRVAP